GSVNTRSSHTPTTTAPERGNSNSLKLIFMLRPCKKRRCGIGRDRRERPRESMPLIGAADRGSGGSGAEPMAAPEPAPYDPPPMTGLDRYMLRQCLSVMIFVTAALSAAVWLAQSLRLVDLIVNRGLSVALFVYMALLILPRFLDI